MELIGRILIVLGAINIMIRWYLAHIADQASSEEILISQSFIKDPALTIEDMIKSMISKVGENIKVSKIIKFDLS